MRVAVLLLCLGAVGRAEPVRISFLDAAGPVSNTLEELQGLGCSPEQLEVFRRAVATYYSGGFEPPLIDRAAILGGWVEYESCIDFVRSMTNRFCDMNRFFEINCFDTALGLVASKMSVDLSSVARYIGANSVWPYPAWYTNYVTQATGLVWNEQHQTLSRVLHARHLLPSMGPDGVEFSVEEKLMRTLGARWGDAGVVFPSNVELVLFHRVSTNHAVMVTDHAGLLWVNRHGGITYLEKAGGSGPFVRIDMEDTGELIDYFSSMLTADMWEQYPQNFVTANRRLLGEVNRHVLERPSDPL